MTTEADYPVIPDAVTAGRPAFPAGLAALAQSVLGIDLDDLADQLIPDQADAVDLAELVEAVTTVAEGQAQLAAQLDQLVLELAPVVGVCRHLLANSAKLRRFGIDLG